jgi:hypothetical protein
MTKLEALKATIEFEYTNDNLFTKVLTDRGITGSATYTASDAQDIDLCLADIYLYLAQHPDYTEGKQSEKWSGIDLIQARNDLFAKYGLRPPEQSAKKVINGTRSW